MRGHDDQAGRETRLRSAITRSRQRRHQRIFVMQAAQYRSGAHLEALAEPMAS